MLRLVFSKGGNMKKSLSFSLVGLATLGLAAGLSSCGTQKAEIALITDIGDIDDKSFNQGAWEGVKAYTAEHSVSHQYYRPSEKSTTAYVDAIELAISNGAKVVVTPGYLFEEPIFLVQDQYPDVHFVLLDGEPHNADYTEYKTGTNVQPILYAEEQAGFLAGYGAVKDGYTKLGFMGGMAVPAVVRYGLGFAAGANEAAEEMSKSVELTYHYTGDFKATPEVKALSKTWYQSGTEVIFACGGSVGQSVMLAAVEESGKVIGVDVDQYNDSPTTVITSAMKGLGASVIEALTAHYDGTWVGGETWNLDASKDGVGLPTAEASWGFNTWTLAEYQAIYGEIADGTLVPLSMIVENYMPTDPKDAVTGTDALLDNIAVTYIA
jgi:basic membrane protein A